MKPFQNVPIDWQTHYVGRGCNCCAYSQSECGCSGADWTDPEIYMLRNMVNELLAANVQT